MTPEAGDDAAPEDLDDVYPALPPVHGDLRRDKAEFRPWHHPRKQYVRINQWCAAARQLIADLKLGAGDPFRYLTLPGSELLDVRALHGVCQPAGVRLRYLGFNSVGRGTRDQAELNLSHSEVRALSGIDSFSSVLEDRVEAIANDRTPAYGQARQRGPFHAINLDLCDSIAFRDIDDRRGSILGVLAKLLELQLQTTGPWLLFITTKAEPELLSERSRDGFKKAIAANAVASADFCAELAKLVSGTADELDTHLARAWTGQDPDFLRLFCTGLGKWLLALLAAAAPSRELLLLSSCYYQVGPNGPDMLSLAFRCNTPPQPVSDQHGILEAPDPPPIFSEIDVAIRLTRQLAGTIDLDRHLADNPDVAGRLIAQAARLLATARYQPADYEAWARQVLGKAQPT